MQVNGIGNSHSDMHQVTTCIHDHKYQLEGKVGGADAGASAVTQQVTSASGQSGETFSLSAWLQNTLSDAKRLLGKIWGSETTSVQGDVTTQAGTETLSDIVLQNTTEIVNDAMNMQNNMQNNMQQNPYQQPTNTTTLHVSQIEAASANVHPLQDYHNNPYFAAVSENTASQQNIWQKIKVRFQNITGFLAKRFSFSNSSTFQTKQERPKEDLRRHSRYREDELEIDCIITDDSYLMDSYNKKGEYSKLSAGK